MWFWGSLFGLWVFSVGIVLFLNYCCHANDRYFGIKDKEE